MLLFNIILNFQVFSMHCYADDVSRMRRMLDENELSRVVPHFLFQKLNMSVKMILSLWVGKFC